MAQLPVFETTRLILRDITERDASAYERHFVELGYLVDSSSPDMLWYQSWRTTPEAWPN